MVVNLQDRLEILVIPALRDSLAAMAIKELWVVRVRGVVLVQLVPQEYLVYQVLVVKDHQESVDRLDTEVLKATLVIQVKSERSTYNTFCSRAYDGIVMEQRSNIISVTER